MKHWHPAAPRADSQAIARFFQRRQRWHCAAVALLLVFCRPLAAQQEVQDQVTPSQMQSGSLLLKMQNGYQVATRMNTNASIKVSGLVARVSVKQSFRNDGSEWVEGVYVFPLPDTAAVDRLRMHIGERFIEGEIREKEQAKKEYKQAKQEGRKASLVEQERPNLFTTSVANIAPGEAVTVEIEYLETLRYEEGTFSLRFPVTLTPRYIPGAPLTERKGSGWSPDTTRVDDASRVTPPVVTRSDSHRLEVTVDLNAGMPLEIVASRYHPIRVSESKGGDKASRYQVALADADTPMDHDFELVWRPVPDSMPRATLFTEDFGGQPHLLLMMIPPNDATIAMPGVARETIFVIDTSGSMHGTSMEQARKALELALGGLRPEDRFNVIQFNSVTHALFHVSVPATLGNIARARSYVQNLSADGGTEMRPALELALHSPAPETHLRQVIFITDGSVGNEDELFAVIEAGLGSARLFTVGIGSAPNGWFMRKAAEAGRGTYTYVSAVHEIDEKMGRLFRKLESPQLTDIRIEWPSGVTVDAYPGTVADLYLGEPIVVKARFSGEPRANSQVTVSGNSASGSWRRTIDLDEMRDRLAGESPGIAAIWARARIEALLDKAQRAADPDSIRQAVIETALQHHLVSKFTSLVAIDKTPVRPQAAGLDSVAVPNLLPYGQSMNAIFGFPATATDAELLRLSGVACLLLALLLVAMRRRSRVCGIHS
ncbi:MAG TPA: marine proteobacterial sortase target protein [Woeseiaceae bacterium]|nr:marine proteobacterial sortase target protein [Woeseiaceae bacterium]